MTPLLSQWILTLLILIPLLGAASLWLLPRQNEALQRHLALGVSLGELVLSVLLILWFAPGTPDMQFTQSLSWIPSAGIRYIVGVDGLSLILVLLTTTLSPLVLLSTYSSVQKNVREFLALFLVLESAMVGTFVAIDLVLFYVFWEAMLIPMYFLIGIWGGKNREYAGLKFFIYTAVGSFLMLVAFVFLYFAHANLSGGEYSTNLLDLFRTIPRLPALQQMWLFAALALAFAIKVPLFPFHTWLPDAHVEAPTAGSVILAGVLLKMGTYGLMRFCLPLFPLASRELASVMMGLGVAGIIYGALIAWRQTDVKKLVAYSSVSHLGFVVAGIFSLTAQGLQGALYQMVSHGISTGALFLLVGVLYERRHTRELDAFGGLAKGMPWFAVFFMAATLGSVALPGTGGFIGEWLILWGVFASHPLLGILAATGVVLGAVYMLWLAYKVLWGPLSSEENIAMPDVNAREALILGVLSIAIFVTGFTPSALLDHTQASLLHLRKGVESLKGVDIRLSGSVPSVQVGLQNE